MEGVKKGLKLYEGINSRQTVTTIARLRTGHCGLNHYLHRFGLRTSPYCECRQGKETVEHYLLECRKYNEQRQKLWKNAGAGRMRVEKLLGYPTLIKHTMEYVAMTKGSKVKWRGKMVIRHKERQKRRRM